MKFNFNAFTFRILMFSLMFHLCLFSCANESPINDEEKPDDLPRNEISVLFYKDASKSDHEMIQKTIDYAAANRIKTVIIPAGKYEVDAAGADGGIQLRDNIHLKLDDKAILKALPNDVPRSNIILISEVSNVKITGGELQGEKNEHFGEGGEWGHGINILSSNNIEINSVIVKDCWGDGIYVAGNSKIGPSENVVIDKIISDNNRRQGLSVVNCIGLIVKNSMFSNTKGTKPEAGIDLEPNKNQSVENVKIINCDFEDNYGYGLICYGVFDKITNVEIDDIRIKNSLIGIVLRDEKSSNIKMNNVHISDISHHNYSAISFNGPSKVEMKNVEILNSRGSALSFTNGAKDIDLHNFNINGFKKTGINIKEESSRINMTSFDVFTDVNTVDGFEIDNSSDIKLDNVNIQNGKIGLTSSQSTNLTIINSKIKNQKDKGILFNETSNSVINQTSFEGIEKSALELLKSKNNKINSNEFIGNAFMPDNTYAQVYFNTDSKENEFKENSLIKGSEIAKSKYGVWLVPSTSDNLLFQNTIATDSYHIEAIKNESANN